MKLGNLRQLQLVVIGVVVGVLLGVWVAYSPTTLSCGSSGQDGTSFLTMWAKES